MFRIVRTALFALLVSSRTEIKKANCCSRSAWVAVDRAQNYAVYDWPPSAPHAQHDITYLIVDLTGRFSFPPYRVSIVNGDPIEYDSAATLVDNLGMIEARRCSGRGHRGRR